MDYLEREFARLQLAYACASHANFFLVDVGDGRAVYDQLLRKGVIVRAMNGYGYPHHVRISVGLPEENRRLIAALTEVLRS